MRLFPGVHPELGFYFGYVVHSGESNSLTDGAPFLSDVLLALAAFLWSRSLRVGSRLRLAVILLGIVSPLMDLAYNYQGGLWRPGTDVWNLLQQLPAVPVHAFFVLSFVGAVAALRSLRPPGDSRVRRAEELR
jgi:hypothetical protein